MRCNLHLHNANPVICQNRIRILKSIGNLGDVLTKSRETIFPCGGGEGLVSSIEWAPRVGREGVLSLRRVEIPRKSVNNPSPQISKIKNQKNQNNRALLGIYLRS